MAETKRQHEALRVPQGWEGQAKALIMQLERILTQLYQITEKTDKNLDDTSESLNLLESDFRCGKTNSVSNLDALKTLISGTVSDMPAYSMRNIVFTLGSTFTPFNNGGTWVANVFKAGNNNLFSAVCNSYNADGVVRIRYTTGSGWVIEKIAKVSDFAEYSYADVSQSGNTWTGGYIRAHRKGYVVTLKFDATVVSAVSSRTTIGTLPQGYRPITESYGVSADNTRNVLVSSTGDVKLEPQSAGTFWAMITYICDR